MKSPFKFLDAYTYQDRAYFFGREEETEELYRMAFKSSLILLYGLSGTGKTSLVQCGLAGRFDGPDWYPLFIRRQDDFNQSLDQALQKAMPASTANIPVLPERVSYLFRYHLRPLYLILDQFEELFILGTEKEQAELGQTLAALTQMESACKVIIIIREEFIGQLYHLEKYLPKLFDFRIRMEPMGYKKVGEVVSRSCQSFNIGFANDEAQSIQLIYDNISAGKTGIQLPYLQVYLDQLYREDYARTYPLEPVVSEAEPWPALQFSLPEIQALGKIENVLGRFLDEQQWQLQTALAQQYSNLPEDAVRMVLDTFVTPEGTKRPIVFSNKQEEIVLEKSMAQWVSSISPSALSSIVTKLISLRIVRQNESTLELAHDTLALLIDQRRTGTQRRMNEVLSRLLIAYKEHQDTQDFLSRRQLNLIEELWPSLEPMLSQEIRAFVDQSRSEMELKEQRALLEERKKRRKATWIAIISSSLALTALIATFVAITKAEQVRKAKNELVLSFFNNQIQSAKTLKVEGKYPAAIASLQGLSPTITQALSASQIDTLNKLKKDWSAVNTLVGEANELLQNEDLVPALDRFRSAQVISPDGRVAGLIHQVETNLDDTFQRLLKSGDIMLNAKQYNRARENYLQALRIKPNDKLVKQKLNTIPQ